MATLINNKKFTTVTPSEPDIKVAKEFRRRMASRTEKDHGITLQVLSESGNTEEALTIPASVFCVLCDMMAAMAQGKTISLIPMDAELSTQEAAELLNVSRPFLIGLLEKGQMPFRLVGSHRRILSRDLLAFKTRSDAQSKKTLDDLTEEAQDMDMGYGFS